MKNLILTISIPTYNRLNYLKKNLNSLYDYISKYSIDDIQIFVSDNGSDDGTAEYLNEIVDTFKHLEINLFTENTGWANNFLTCFKLAKGKYIHILADDDYLTEQYFVNVVSLLRLESFDSINLKPYSIHIGNKNFKSEEYNNPNRFLFGTCLNHTLLSSNIVKSNLLSISNDIAYHERNFAHMKYVLQSITNGKKFLYIKSPCIQVTADNSSNYQYCKVFGYELFKIYSDFYDEVLVRKLKKKYLLLFYPVDLFRIGNYLPEQESEQIERLLFLYNGKILKKIYAIYINKKLTVLVKIHAFIIKLITRHPIYLIKKIFY